MQIILLKDIPKFGKKYDVKIVRDGYGRNFLLPQKLAMLSSSVNLKHLEAMKKAGEEKNEKTVKEIISILAKLKEKEIVLSLKANEKGELFGSVSSKMISEELKKQGLNISEEYINLEENIKHIGEYEIKVKVGENKDSFKLNINKE